ncbi:MAG: hypothetical protein IKD71_10160 [Solobacterium sp.]|nr:hypothetical protein [Solobacterium sp.]
MYRCVNIYEPVDPEDLEVVLNAVKNAASQLPNRAGYETGFDMDTGSVCLILDFATRADCLYWPQSKEYIGLQKDLPPLQNESSISYWREDD